MTGRGADGPTGVAMPPLIAAGVCTGTRLPATSDWVEIDCVVVFASLTSNVNDELLPSADYKWATSGEISGEQYPPTDRLADGTPHKFLLPVLARLRVQSTPKPVRPLGQVSNRRNECWNYRARHM